ncbi:MAG: hydroxymethylglutaryl-CoA lyase, partial [Congregibacter sp.]|nr:hydroxymethylglutaryl-CoA lyase [Congregibacter sp.]
NRTAGVTYAALTPNLQGFERAMEAEANEVAVFAAASESFSQRNINCSISESIQRFSPVMKAAKAAGIPVRGYVSCVLGCPYEGHIPPSAVLSVAQALLDLGCYEVSLGDTIGTGTPGSMTTLLSTLIPTIPANKLALHCHNSYGQALANILVGLQHGITRIDSSVAGLGGCPYASGASGNVASEDVVYMLQGLGIETGVDLDALIAVGDACCKKLKRDNHSAVANAKAP